MKRRMIAGALILLALSMAAACVNVPGLGSASVFNMDKKNVYIWFQTEDETYAYVYKTN